MKKIVKCEVELPAGYENDGMLENLLSAKIEDAFAESYGVNGDDIMAYNVEVINESVSYTHLTLPTKLEV